MYRTTITAYRRNDIEDEETRNEPAARAVVKARIARAVAGAFGVAGGGAMFGVAIARGISWDFLSTSDVNDGLLVTILGAAWVMAGLGYIVGGAAAEIRVAVTVARDRARSAHPRDLANERRADLAWLSARWEAASLSLPLGAMTMLLPMTIHFIVWACLGMKFPYWRDFDVWIRTSIAWVGLAHLTLLLCGYDFAATIARMPEVDVSFGHKAGCRAMEVTVLTACLPGIILLGIPPLLTGITGVGPVLLAFRSAARRVACERAVLREAGI